ncbi:hypothetical protein Hypma_010602 [Hypsizygus marmoreus]|uniref:Uncharacterized protein n=1 Tax=Hypsizygus marmoreus TaxID=39966 RepID=A0A369JRF1_HYPMA|nr:hypothetical protein Hypma_010602 [Hypsizygus marmoreus]
MEESATTTVIQGTLITSGVSAFISGLYGISTRNPRYGFIAAAAAINSGVTAVTFFGIREYLISPLLVSTLPWPQYVRRRRELGINDASDDSSSALGPPTWSDLRQHKTLDTGISGVLAGGALRGWKSGPRAIVPGALTIGAVCTLLQLAYNEIGITRLRYVSGLNGTLSVPKSSSPPSKSLSQRFLGLLGLQAVTDEEYLAKMKTTRDSHVKRIAELERQIQQEQVKDSEENKSS